MTIQNNCFTSLESIKYLNYRGLLYGQSVAHLDLREAIYIINTKSMKLALICNILFLNTILIKSCLLCRKKTFKVNLSIYIYIIYIYLSILYLSIRGVREYLCRGVGHIFVVPSLKNPFFEKILIPFFTM